MAMTPYSGETEIIGKLGTTPQERGLTTQQFKDKFDEGLKAFITWFNATHKTEFDAHLAEKATSTTLGHIKAGVGTSIDVNGILTSGGFKVINFGRDISLTGDQIIANVGFRPRFVLFLATLPGVAGSMSMGFGDTLTHVSLADYHNRTANAYNVVARDIVFFGSTGNDARGTVSAFSDNGFTITWEKNGTMSGNANINAVCFK